MKPGIEPWRGNQARRDRQVILPILSSCPNLSASGLPKTKIENPKSKIQFTRFHTGCPVTAARAILADVLRISIMPSGLQNAA